MCSVVTVACVIPYGSVDWFQTRNRVCEHSPPANNATKIFHPTAVLCHTADPHTLRRLRKKPLIFLATLHDQSYVYLSVNSDHNANLLHSISSAPCGYGYNNNHFCCTYSEHQEETRSENFTYVKAYHKDPYFHIEDIYYGKSGHLHHKIQFTHVTEDLEHIKVSAEHNCRSDVLVDPYPEVHLEINNEIENRSLYFHWYL